MNANALPAPRFVRRTQLGPNEYRKNFRQVDSDAIEAVTSDEACRVTPLMSKIYLRLLNAPSGFWEREGVLRFGGELREEGNFTAWKSLCELAGVASATARKALLWMHEQGIIGYFAGKNGVGIRVFFNRAASSIGTRPGGQKILEFPRTSNKARRASTDEVAFNDSFAVIEVSDENINPRAPEGGAGRTVEVKTAAEGGGAEVEEVVRRLGRELERSLEAAARQAAAREHERTREWLESKGLPKAARVAQKEAYNVLRRHGLFRNGAQTTNADVGRARPAEEPSRLSDGEVEEFAGACVALLEVKGQPVELTLAQMEADAGGFLPPADALRVRARVEALLRGSL